jgi:hypothetical protein
MLDLRAQHHNLWMPVEKIHLHLDAAWQRDIVCVHASDIRRRGDREAEVKSPDQTAPRLREEPHVRISAANLFNGLPLGRLGAIVNNKDFRQAVRRNAGEGFIEPARSIVGGNKYLNARGMFHAHGKLISLIHP